MCNICGSQFEQTLFIALISTSITEKENAVIFAVKFPGLHSASCKLHFLFFAPYCQLYTTVPVCCASVLCQGARVESRYLLLFVSSFKKPLKVAITCKYNHSFGCTCRNIHVFLINFHARLYWFSFILLTWMLRSILHMKIVMVWGVIKSTTMIFYKV